MLQPLLIVLLLVLGGTSARRPSYIRFQDNAYSGITVSLSPEIQRSHRETLIKDLQVSNTAFVSPDTQRQSLTFRPATDRSFVPVLAVHSHSVLRSHGNAV